jgi:hypothetical protein
MRVDWWEGSNYSTAAPPNVVPWAVLEGDTHGGVAEPNLVTGCEPVVGPLPAGSDLDYDGTSYWAGLAQQADGGPVPLAVPAAAADHGWRARVRADRVRDDRGGHRGLLPAQRQGCAVPPPGGRGNFYPYWTLAKVAGQCVWEFGQMTNARTFGGTSQYGGPSPVFVGNLHGPIMPNPGCG